MNNYQAVRKLYNRSSSAQLDLDAKMVEEAVSRVAQELDLKPSSAHIHRNDVMMLYSLLAHEDMWEQAVYSYFYEGASIAQQLKRLSDTHELNTRAVLDFGAGYGRVSRYLQNALPQSDFYVSEVKRSCLNFLKKELKLKPLGQSSFAPQGQWPCFDLILAISVFTHLPRDLGYNWLEHLSKRLNPGGALVFTYKEMGRNRLHLGRFKRYLYNRKFVYLKSSEDTELPFIKDANLNTELYGVSFIHNKLLEQWAKKLNLHFQLLDQGLSSSQQLAILYKAK